MANRRNQLTPFVCGLCCASLSWGVLAASDADHAYGDTSANGQTLQLDTISVVGAPVRDYTTLSSGTTLGTDTPIQDTPFSVTPVTKTLLDDQAADSVREAMRNVPGVSVALGEGNRDEVYIRGVKTKSDFFMNGMRDDSEYIRPMYNVERIDVLKGPAALQFGRGGSGGIVNVVKKKAERRDIRHIELQTGSWQKLQGSFDYGTPMGDNAAFRLMGMHEHSGGFRDNAKTRRYAINPEFYVNVDGHTDINFGASYLKDNRHIDRGIPSHDGHPDYRIDRKTFFGDKDQNRYEQKVMSAHFDVDHDINDNWTVSNRLRWNRNDRDYVNYYPGTATEDNGDFKFKGYRHPMKRDTIEDRLEFKGVIDTGTMTHTLLTGIDYTWQRDHDIETRPPSAGGSKTLPDYDGNIFTQHTIDGEAMPWSNPAARNRDNVVYGKALGVFLQDQIELNEHWTVLAGGRYMRFSSTADYRYDNEHQHRVDYKLSPRAAITYKPTENNTMYVSFSRNYTPAGANISLDHHSSNGGDIAPQRADSYEIGDKLSLLDDRLLLTAALFQINQDHIKDKDPNGDDKLPIGKHRTRGIELSATGNITDQWRIVASYAYLDATIRKHVDDIPKGNRIALVPRNQFSIWSTYAVNDHWGFGGGIHGESKKYASVANDVYLPGYVVGGLMAYYQQDHYRLQINVENVTNKHFYPTAQNNNEIMPGTPRAVYATLKVDF